MRFILFFAIVILAFIMGHIYGDVALDLSKKLPTISIEMPSDRP